MRHRDKEGEEISATKLVRGRSCRPKRVIKCKFRRRINVRSEYSISGTTWSSVVVCLCSVPRVKTVSLLYKVSDLSCHLTKI